MSKKLYQLYVPIPNYTNDGIHFQEMFVSSEKCPTNRRWLALAEKYHLRDSEHVDYTEDWNEVCDCISRAIVNAAFPYLYENQCLDSNHVQTAFGLQPITLRTPYVEEVD